MPQELEGDPVDVEQPHLEVDNPHRVKGAGVIFYNKLNIIIIIINLFTYFLYLFTTQFIVDI
jgi:hypothetical protein